MELFGEYGEVSSAKVIMDRETGNSKGYGFVEMDDDDAGRAAIEALNDMEYDGRRMVVKEARPREEMGNRGGGGFRRDNRGGGGYGGGRGGYDRDNRGGGRGGDRGGYDRDNRGGGRGGYDRDNRGGGRGNSGW